MSYNRPKQSDKLMELDDMMEFDDVMAGAGTFVDVHLVQNYVPTRFNRRQNHFHISHNVILGLNCVYILNGV